MVVPGAEPPILLNIIPADPDSIAELTDYLIFGRVDQRNTVLGHLAATDERMCREYAKATACDPDMYAFQPGDLVWLK